MSPPAETFVVTCPHCQGRATAASDQSGETVRCPHCEQPFVAVPPPVSPWPPAHAVTPQSASPHGPPTSPSRPAGRRFSFRCRRCASVLEARSDQSGRHARCPTCGADFVIPQMDPRTGFALGYADPGDDGENPTPMHAYAAAGKRAPQLIRIDDEHLAIECPRCQNRAAVSVNNCPRCGLPFTLEGMSPDTGVQESGRGALALALAIVALPLSLCSLFGIVPATLAIGLGLWSRADLRPRRTSADLAAIILGLLAVATAVAVHGLALL